MLEGVGVVLEQLGRCWSELEGWLGVAWNSVGGVRGCWSGVGFGVDWRGGLEWLGVAWNSIGGC